MWDLQTIIAMNKQCQDEFDQRQPEVAQLRNLRDMSSSEPGPSSPKCDSGEKAQAVVAPLPKAMEKREHIEIRLDIEIRVDIDTVEL